MMSMIQMVELKADIFILSTSTDASIIYSPLRGVAFYANPEATSIIKEYLESRSISKETKRPIVYDYLDKLSQIEVEEPKKEKINSTDAILILSQICNLSCSYCYAQKSRSKEILSIEKIKAIVDSLCASTSKKSKSFSFIGGGEPLATWDVFECSVNYIRKTTEQNGFSGRIRLTTNGTLLNEKRILFLKENKIVISISFDILPDIQNDQRPFPDKRTSSFERVHNNIKLLLSNGIFPKIRSTITKNNVNLMPQMVEFVIANYPKLKYLHFEPVTDVTENSDDFYRAYIASFMEARRLSKQHGLYLNNSIIRSFDKIHTRFCNGEFCITPSSDIVSCHRISSDREECFDSFKYGKVTNAIEIDSKSMNHVLEISEKKNKPCANCFAKWHCAGGCTMYRAISSEKEQLSYCTFVKDILLAVLDEHLGGWVQTPKMALQL